MSKTNDAIIKELPEWLESSGYIKKDLAQKLNVSPAALTKMFSGEMEIPFPRFLQLVYFLRPLQEDVNKIFAAFCDELNIPTNAMQLRLNLPAAMRSDEGELRNRMRNKIGRLSDEQLTAIEPIVDLLLKTTNQETENE